MMMMYRWSDESSFPKARPFVVGEKQAFGYCGGPLPVDMVDDWC